MGDRGDEWPKLGFEEHAEAGEALVWRNVRVWIPVAVMVTVVLG